MSDARDRGNGPTFLALAGLLAAAAGLIALTAMVLPQILAFVLVGFGFIILGLLQYLVWGRWMTRTPVDDDEPPK